MIASDYEKGTSNSKSEIQGFFPFDKLRVRMTDIIPASTGSVRLI
jgi:hypothetical protein